MTNRTPLERASARERQRLGYTDDDTDTGTLATTGNVSARSTTIQGDRVDLAEPRTTITFEDEHGLLSGEYGHPRPREFWHAKQLGQTPPMELLKNAVARQLTGGQPKIEADEELEGAVADFADLVLDIYDGPHFQNKSLDNLLVDAICDMIDFGWAYQELLASADGEFPVVAFKPLPPLQIQHNVDDDTGMLIEDPAYYQVPYRMVGNNIQTQGEEPTSLENNRVVDLRDPLATTSDTLYGESIATKVREWLELIIDVDVHEKRHYSDSQLPAGFLHFLGNVKPEKLKGIEQDIQEAAGDPHDLVTTTAEEDVKWIPVGESVVDLDAIQQQTWYFKLVFAAAGLNLNELGVIEGSGFAKETPALQRAIMKNVTKPFMNAFFDPHNSEVVPQLAESVGLDEVPFRLTLERYDPHHEQIEREETMSEWSQGLTSLNETRGAMGRDAVEFPFDIGGEEIDLADTPRRIVDLLMKRDRPEVSMEGEGGEASASGSHAEKGAPDFEKDPVLSEREAFDTLEAAWNPQATRQLEDTVDVESSFIESVAYARPTNFLQIEFERDGTNAVYWYGSMEEYRFWNMIQANSKGKYFNRHIRGEYVYARVQ